MDEEIKSFVKVLDKDIENLKYYSNRKGLEFETGGTVLAEIAMIINNVTNLSKKAWNKILDSSKRKRFEDAIDNGKLLLKEYTTRNKMEFSSRGKFKKDQKFMKKLKEDLNKVLANFLIARGILLVEMKKDNKKSWIKRLLRI